MADVVKKIVGNGVITDVDYKIIKWVGLTKAGKPIKITITDAINMGNTEWEFKEKDEVVSEVVFTACYTGEETDYKEPWEIEYTANSTATAADNIALGVGKLYIGETAIALSRGGGKFTREPEFREIVADGDRGPVKDRITIDSVRATLSLNILTILGRMTDIYTGMTESVVTGS